jgi:uncharacterized protein
VLTLNTRQVRRLALLRAGLLRPEWLGLPARSRARGASAVGRCHQWIEHFGYLQLDTVAVAGARTQGIVLASRLAGLDANTVETLLAPGQPVFEYWGHEACWLPLSMYPLFGFRRDDFRVHPWWGDLLTEHAALAAQLLERAREEGPFRSIDLEGERRPGWWDIKLAKRIADALWSSGALVIRERRNFQRIYDLPERVIPAPLLGAHVPRDAAVRALLLRALAGHGFASTGLLAATWRLRNVRPVIDVALRELTEAGEILPAEYVEGKRTQGGWLLASDVDRLDRIDNARVHGGRGVLLSPFDPVLWDRRRVQSLFNFEQRIEIYKPAEQRQYGYYCLPVLAGERLVGRVDLKAERNTGSLKVLALHREPAKCRDVARDAAAIEHALERFAGQVGLMVRHP